jgi:hypothetical protein
MVTHCVPPEKGASGGRNPGPEPAADLPSGAGWPSIPGRQPNIRAPFKGWSSEARKGATPMLTHAASTPDGLGAF